ncbi:MAG: hypothetical protein K6G26_11220, partial [Lachnospiraceae bacterium]|nr:hypothetical protein [Lachnospiraceae bacterium]
MNSIVNMIFNVIKSKVPNYNQKAIVCISGIEDITIYEGLCKKLIKEYGENIVLKLSKEKWEDFCINGSIDTSIKQVMESNEWIANDKSLTYYRNLTDKIIILMGTEMVEDQGGLNDCFLITPDTIKKVIHGEYYKL